MNKTQGKDDKWSQPGWRIEQKYGNKVLIGNWEEEKRQFTREAEAANSTNRTDYLPRWDFQPDISVRASSLRRAEGLPSKLLLAHHHGTAPSHYHVTLYDETYGRRHLSTPPTLRSWHPDSLTWQPERSDHPLPAPPTNFGLWESKLAHVERQQSHLPSLSVYRSTYQGHPLSAFCQSHVAKAPPRMLSSRLHAANHNNKDLDLRQRSLLQVPDHSPSLLPSLWQP